ncbi:MAG: hypothetical protein JWL77_6299 [Chthonomonadaceae bacterium]|nr:hypothetical protein [Chthonomonadaceae bacterium]
MQSGKRIVSKVEYIANTAKKAALTSYGAGVLLLGFACTAITFVRVVPAIWPKHTSDIFTCVAGLGILGIGTAVLFYYGRKAVQDAINIDTGVPFTRANTTHLPAAESLVRPSEEPAQDKDSTLLRAAIHLQPTPPEEMVRASIGPQDSGRQQ